MTVKDFSSLERELLLRTKLLESYLSSLDKELREEFSVALIKADFKKKKDLEKLNIIQEAFNRKIEETQNKLSKIKGFSDKDRSSIKESIDVLNKRIDKIKIPSVSNLVSQEEYDRSIEEMKELMEEKLKVVAHKTTVVNSREKRASIRIIDTSASASLRDEIFLVDATNGEVAVTLPNLTKGKVYHVKKIDSSSNNVVISGAIDGNDCVTITQQYTSIMLVGGTSEWSII